MLTLELQKQRSVDVVLTPLMVAVSQPGYPAWTELLFVAVVAVSLLLRQWTPAVLVG
jgi:hypothetical protein